MMVMIWRAVCRWTKWRRANWWRAGGGEEDSDAEGDERKLRFRDGDSNAVGDDEGDGGDAYDDEKDEGGFEREEHKLSFD